MDQPSPVPKLAIHVARAQLITVAVIALAGLAAGIGLQLELWAPGATWSAERYRQLLGLHATLAVAVGAPVLAGSFGYVAVTELVGARRVVAPALAWIGLALWWIGAITMIAAAVGSSNDTGWTLYTPYHEPSKSDQLAVLAPIALALAGLVYTLHLAIVTITQLRTLTLVRGALAWVLVLALGAASAFALIDALSQLVATYRDAGALLIGDGLASSSAPSVSTATGVAALVLATAALARGVTRGAHQLVTLIALAAVVAWSIAPPLGIVAVALWVPLAIWGGLRPVAALTVLGVASSLVVALLARHLLVDESFLHDTHVAVAQEHLIAAMIALAALAALHAWGDAIVGRPPHAVVAWIGAIATSAGVALHASASIRLGASGMPRRYWDYEPSLAGGHQLAGLGVALVVVGLVTLAIAWLVGRAPDPRRS
jgi:cytochrome c oxidase subunit I